MDQIKTGNLIAQYRRKKGLTQAELAEQLGVSDRAVSKWETGRSLPDANNMLELSEILEITVDELLKGKKQMKEGMIRWLKLSTSLTRNNRRPKTIK